MTIYFKNLKLKTHPDVYEPADDSMLLADNLEVENGDMVLDMGTGTGILALSVAKKAKNVLAVDINPKAIEIARENSTLNKIENIEFRISDLFGNIKKNEKFDLIIFNPPYLPVDEKDMLGRSWSGGEKGREIIEKFLKSASDHLKKNGRIQLVVSSLNDLDKIRKKLKEKNFEFEILARKKLWFEEIYVLLAIKH